MPREEGHPIGQQKAVREHVGLNLRSHTAAEAGAQVELPGGAVEDENLVKGGELSRGADYLE
jgi:hypothetical protein